MYDDQDVLIQPGLSAPLDAYWDNGLSWLLGLLEAATPGGFDYPNWMAGIISD